MSSTGARQESLVKLHKKQGFGFQVSGVRIKRITSHLLDISYEAANYRSVGSRCKRDACQNEVGTVADPTLSIERSS